MTRKKKATYRYKRLGIWLKSGIGPCKLQFLRLLEQHNEKKKKNTKNLDMNM
jgi:hypothetical protein